LSRHFADLSPGKELGQSPFENMVALKRPGGMRRMLTKSQSMATDPRSEVHPGSTQLAGSSTPTRISRTQSLPESPLRRNEYESTSDPALFLMPAAAPQEDSEGSAKRTYGKSRSFAITAESRKSTAPSEIPGESDVSAKESYAELRKRYEVDNSDVNGSRSSSSTTVGISKVGNLITVGLAPSTSTSERFRHAVERRK
jgi:hypothetical protein